MKKTAGLLAIIIITGCIVVAHQIPAQAAPWFGPTYVNNNLQPATRLHTFMDSQDRFRFVYEKPESATAYRIYNKTLSLTTGYSQEIPVETVPSSNRTYSVDFAEDNGNLYYLITKHAAFSMYKSVDNGATWQLTNTITRNPTIQCQGKDSKSFFRKDANGNIIDVVYTDIIFSFFCTDRLFSIAFDPNTGALDPATASLVTASGTSLAQSGNIRSVMTEPVSGMILIGTMGQGLYYTVDNGQTHVHVPVIVSVPKSQRLQGLHDFTLVQGSGGQPSRFLFVRSYDDLNGTPVNTDDRLVVNLGVSTDGINWTQQEVFSVPRIGADIKDLKIAAYGQKIVIAYREDNKRIKAYESVDNGQSWTSGLVYELPTTQPPLPVVTFDNVGELDLEAVQHPWIGNIYVIGTSARYADPNGTFPSLIYLGL